MDDKILCPYCGAEMKRNWKCTGYGEAAREAWYVCEVCKSDSPTVWGCDYETAVKLATEAALRRYTPPIWPMDFETASRVIASGETTPLYFEDNDGDGDWEISYKLRRLLYNAPNDYGKTWRCWEHKPTDEERSAAEWET